MALLQMQWNISGPMRAALLDRFIAYRRINERVRIELNRHRWRRSRARIRWVARRFTLCVPSIEC
jgi:hypothetical protein